MTHIHCLENCSPENHGSLGIPNFPALHKTRVTGRECIFYLVSVIAGTLGARAAITHQFTTYTTNIYYIHILPNTCSIITKLQEKPKPNIFVQTCFHQTKFLHTIQYLQRITPCFQQIAYAIFYKTKNCKICKYSNSKLRQS